MKPYTTSKMNQNGIVKKTVVIRASPKKVWQKISNIIGLAEWVMEVKRTVYRSNIKRGVGAIRKITFNDGNNVVEHIVGWKDGKYLSYIAVSGLPLRGYHATISVKPKNKKSVVLTWQSYMNSIKMTKKEFNEFRSFVGQFYQTSLKNLKLKLE